MSPRIRTLKPPPTSGTCETCGVDVALDEPGALVRRLDGRSRFYCPVHAGRVVPRKRRERRGFRLTPDERAAIFAGEHPRLERPPDEPELDVGAVVELSTNVTITITQKGRNKRNLIQYRYTVADQRLDRPRLLRQTPPAHRSEHDEEDRLRPLTPALEARAAEESAYTSSRISAMPNEPENMDPPRALAAQARLRRAKSSERSEELAKRQARSINESVRDVLIQRARLGLPGDSPGLLALTGAIEQMRAELEGSQDAA